jgi:hypothetical protein
VLRDELRQGIRLDPRLGCLAADLAAGLAGAAMHHHRGGRRASHDRGIRALLAEATADGPAVEARRRTARAPATSTRPTCPDYIEPHDQRATLVTRRDGAT